MKDDVSHFINGAWQSAVGRERSVADDTATAAPIALVAHAEADEIDDAVLAARAAFSAWSANTQASRHRYLRAIADASKTGSQVLAETILREVAMLLKLSRRIMGLVNRLFAADELMPAVLRHATDPAQNMSPASARVMKEQLSAAPFQSLSEAVLLANRRCSTASKRRLQRRRRAFH